MSTLDKNQGTPKPQPAIKTGQAEKPTETAKPAEGQATDPTPEAKTETAKPALEVSKADKDYYLVEIFTGNRFDPHTGEKLNNSYTQKYSARAFKQFEENAPRLGITYEVVYNPTKPA